MLILYRVILSLSAAFKKKSDLSENKPDFHISKNIGYTDGCRFSSTGVSPSCGSRITLPIACDASPPESRLHARAVAVRESHYPAGSLSPVSQVTRENRSRFTSSCLSLAPEITGGHGAPSAWLVADRSYPSALYCREYSASAFFVKEPGNPCGKGYVWVPPGFNSDQSPG